MSIGRFPDSKVMQAHMANWATWAGALGAAAIVGVLFVAAAAKSGKRRSNETDLQTTARQAHALSASLAATVGLVGIAAHVVGQATPAMRIGRFSRLHFYLFLGGGILMIGAVAAVLVQYFEGAPQQPLERNSSFDRDHESAAAAAAAAAVLGIGAAALFAGSMLEHHNRSVADAHSSTDFAPLTHIEMRKR